MASRIEKDTFGPIEVPAERLWGAQTQRSLQNFRISSEKMPPALITALAQVKRAAAQVNVDLRVLDPKKGRAIIEAADEVIAGKHDGEFPLAVWQTGSGRRSAAGSLSSTTGSGISRPRCSTCASWRSAALPWARG